MKNKLIKLIIPIFCLLIFGNISYADTEGDVIVVTNVPYTASVTKGATTEGVTMDATNGTHTGLSTVFTLQTNGGDDHFDYIIKSYVDVGGERIPAYGDDGRLTFVHTTISPTTTAVNNAKAGILPSKNVFAYPTRINCTGGVKSSFKTNYKDYGNCHVILMDQAVITDVTHTVQGTPSANTYEPGNDEAGNYQTTIEFTVVAK